MSEKSLDKKITRILNDPMCEDFILADAKDADMAGGMAACGKSPENYASEARYRSVEEYRQLIRDNVNQGLVDIMLMSASTNEQLTIKERFFENSHITPAARANDTTDIWLAMGGVYPSEPSRPFRSATIDHIMCGKAACEADERCKGADLGLYSMTFNNDLERDKEAHEYYNQFRIEAEKKGFRHFLEIFSPNACGDHCPKDLGRFINDMVARALAGVTSSGRPLFLKIPYTGPAAMEQLATYDRSVIPGILGGASGTTYDAFDQLAEAKRYGARVALYGRMINNSEHQLTFIQHLRWLADGELLDPAEAVRSYHGALQTLQITPYRSLEEDLVPTLRGTAYSASTGKTIVTKPQAKIASSASKPVTQVTAKSDASSVLSGQDVEKMTSAQRVKYNLDKWNRILG